MIDYFFGTVWKGYSSDGINWTSGTVGSNPLLSEITYGNSTFVAVGSGGKIFTSTDGSTWTSRTSGTTNSLQAVTYGNNLFVVGGTRSTLLTSPDGVTWTPRTPGTLDTTNVNYEFSGAAYKE